VHSPNFGGPADRVCDANEAAPRDERTTIGTVPQHQPLLAAVDLDQMTLLSVPAHLLRGN